MGIMDSVLATLNLAKPLEPVGEWSDNSQPSIYSSPEEWAIYRSRQAGIGAPPSQGPASAPIANIVAKNPIAALLGSMDNPIVAPTPGQDPNDTLASVQDRVDWLMQNDPFFKDAMSGKAPKDSGQDAIQTDPLKADKNGWNLPKTGSVNTTGAMQRINARAQAESSGVSATRDSSGQLTLSNISPENKGPSLVAPNVSSSLLNSVELLKKATDPDAARGIMANIRESAALEQARIEGMANDFASSKLGVPELQKALMESESTDKTDPLYYPGIGDSPITQVLRNQVNTARTAAEFESKRFLESNTNSAALKATLATASFEMKRMEALAIKKDNLSTNLELRAADSAAKREEIRQEKNDEILSTLNPAARKRLAILNPQYEKSGNDDKDMANLFKAATKNKVRLEALAAPESELPFLALSGNPDAIALTVAGEITNNPGASKDIIEAKLIKIREAALAPDFAKKMIAFRHPGKEGSEEAKKELLALNTGKMSLDATDKENNRIQRFHTALEMERAGATNKFMDDTASWGINDDAFIRAQQDSLRIAKNRRMDNVLNAYVGSFRDDGALAKLYAFNALVDKASMSQKDSIFGRPDPARVKALVIERARSSGIVDVIKKHIQENSSNSLDIMGALVGWDNTSNSSLVDPETGQLRKLP
jgi:hypothetical protein